MTANHSNIHMKQFKSTVAGSLENKDIDKEYKYVSELHGK